MFEFKFAIPTAVVFSPGSLAGVGAEVRRFASSTLVVTGAGSARRSGVLGRCIDALVRAGVHATVYDGVTVNPTDRQVGEAAALFAASGCDSVLGLGGGGAMDTARCVALAASHGGDFWDYRVTGSRGVQGIEDKLPPVFTVPTTAGTGAEISPAALVVRDGRKEVFFSPHLFPKVAVVDPSLAVTVPPDVTAKVGVDALVQGLEAYVSSAAQPFSDVFALEAVRLSVAWLPRAVEDGADVTARAWTALAAMLSLFAINQAGVGAIHALSNPLSGRFGLHHGHALSILAPVVVERNWGANPERFARVASLFGLGAAGTDEAAAAAFAGRLRDWLAGIGLRGSLRGLVGNGIGGADLDGMAEEAKNPDMATNPRELSTAEIRRMYEALL